MIGEKSSMYIAIGEDGFLLIENERPVMKGVRFPMKRLCPIDAIPRTITATAIMSEFPVTIVLDEMGFDCGM